MREAGGLAGILYQTGFVHRLDASNGFVEQNHHATHHFHMKSGLETALPHAPVLESGFVIIMLKPECRGLEVKGQWSSSVSKCF